MLETPLPGMSCDFIARTLCPRLGNLRQGLGTQEPLVALQQRKHDRRGTFQIRSGGHRLDWEDKEKETSSSLMQLCNWKGPDFVEWK